MDRQILERVLRILSENIVGVHYDGRLDADTPLLSSGLNLDSVAVLELVLEVENEFAVAFSDADLSVELFKTAQTLAEAVEQKIRTHAMATSEKSQG